MTFDKCLIKEVSKYRCIYDMYCMEHKQRDVIEKAWKNISAKLNKPISLIKAKWRYFQDKYRKCIKIAAERHGRPLSARHRQWYLLPLFDFMKDIQITNDAVTASSLFASQFQNNSLENDCPPLVLFNKTVSSKMSETNSVSYQSSDDSKSGSPNTSSVEKQPASTSFSSKSSLNSDFMKNESLQFTLSNSVGIAPNSSSQNYFDSISIKEEPLSHILNETVLKESNEQKPLEESDFSSSNVILTTSKNSDTLHFETQSNSNATSELSIKESMSHSVLPTTNTKSIKLNHLQKYPKGDDTGTYTDAEKLSLYQVYSEEELFLLSLAPSFSRLSPKKKSLLKIKIQQLFYEAEFGNFQ